MVNGDGSVTLTWEAPDDDSVTGYLILRRRPHEGESTLLGYVGNTGSTETTFTDTNGTAGTRHVYRVKAINDAGPGKQSNYVNVDRCRLGSCLITEHQTVLAMDRHRPAEMWEASWADLVLPYSAWL